jgi:ketopantoate reductase
LVLFSVKSHDTEETARQLSRHVGSDALIVSLQNGVDNVERIRAAAACFFPMCGLSAVGFAINRHI